MKNLLIALYSILFIQAPVVAQTTSTTIKASIDKLLSDKYGPNDPGVSVLVAKKGKMIYANAFGSANLELNVPLKESMLFNLGSITKQFTVVAILQLMENGRLSLQDSVQKYIPEFPSKSHTITIENLLTHTSGLKDYLQIDYKEPYLERRDFAPKELIEYFKNEILEFEPGTRYKYSNTGYFLLGYIIEIVSGKPYKDYLQEDIFNRLGLKNTFYDSSNKIFPNRSYGYKRTAGYEKADYWGASIPYAAGGLISNANDLLIWHNGLLAGKLLKKETLQKAFTPFVLQNGVNINYGYGWLVNNIGGSLTISHGGAITGYRTAEIYYPEQDIYMVVLSNCDCTPIDDLVGGISASVLGKPLQVDSKQPDSVLNSYIGVYALTSDPKRKIKIVKENGILVAYISEREAYALVFQSESKFEFKGIYDAKCDFIIKNVIVSELKINQNGIYNWKKIE